MTLLLTERETPEGVVVAVCDAGLLGETYEEGRVSLTVTEEFYGGDPASAEEVAAALGRAKTANIVGEDSVAAAVDAGFVDPGNVLEVEGTVHAQYVRM